MAQKQLTVQYEEFDSPDQLAEDEQKLIAAAWQVRPNAYAPYSNFQVGAAVLTRDGQIFSGANYEVANFKGTCAERAALITANTAGNQNSIAKIAVVGGPATLDLTLIPETPEEPVTPCGQCRQDINEVEDLGNGPIVIILASRNQIRKFISVDSLLPFAFGPANLK